MNLNLNKLLRSKRSVTITEYDQTCKVIYLGNVMTTWAKGDGCVDKPLTTLWKNYCQSTRPDIEMKITVCQSGLKAVTKEHGLTEYWANRITYCQCHPHYPKVLCWIYRHEGKKLKPELRCHAVLFNKEEKARDFNQKLHEKLAQALSEFKREKVGRQNARLSLANCVYDNPTMPRRKLMLSTGMVNYRPPLEKSKSAPKLKSITESTEEIEIDEGLNSDDGNSVSCYGSCPKETYDIQHKIDQLEVEGLKQEESDELLDSVFTSDLIGERRMSDELDLLNEIHDERLNRIMNGTKDLLMDECDTISDESGYSEENELGSSSAKDFVMKM